MANGPTKDAKLTAHNKGVLEFLERTQVKQPPKGRTVLARLYRAGWMSAKTAMEN